MAESIKLLRADIAEILYNTDDFQVLQAIYTKLKELQHASENQDDPPFLDAVRPIKSTKSLSEIIKEQDYKPISYSSYRRKVNGVKWKQSLDELLAALD